MAKKDKKATVPQPTAEQTTAALQDGFLKRNLYQIIVFVFSFILFANSIGNDYNLDDELVTRNHRLTSKGISAIPEIFKSTYYKDQFYAYEYRPVVLATFAIEHSFFGDDPQVSHFINVLLYSLFCVLLFNTLKQLFPHLNPIFFLIVTLIFAAHPSHTEVVDNIKCRDEILAFLFSLITLRMGVRFARETVLSRKVLWAALIAPMFLLALLNKLTIISFAVIIPVTLTLFEGVTLAEIIIVSLLLIIPSLMLVNMNNLFQKIGFGVLLLLVNVGFYGLMNWTEIKAYFNFSFTTNNAEANQDIKQQLLKPGTGFKILLEGIAVPRDIFSFGAVLLTVILTGLYIAGLFFQLKWLFISTGVSLLGLTIFGSRQVSWWATIFFYLACTITLFQFPLGASTYGDLVSLGLVYHIFFGRRDLVIPALVLLGIYTGVNVIWQGNCNGLFFFLFFLFLRHKYTWILLFPLFMFTIFSTPDALLHIESLWSRDNGWVLVVLLLITVLLRRNAAPLAITFKVLSLVVLFYYQAYYGGSINKATLTYTQSQELALKTNSTIIPGTQNRPLDFIEQPVKNSSPLSTRLGTSAEILFHYFYKTILPYPLSFYYGYKFIEPMEPTAPKAFIGLLVLTLLVGIGIWQLRKDRIISYWLFFYIISILVFSNFLIPVPGLLGDRFLFVPSLAWCFLFVWMLFKLLKISPFNYIAWSGLNNYVRIASIALLVIYSGITFARNFDWKDDVTLFAHDNSYVSNSAQANNLLGVHLMVRSNNEKNVAESFKIRKEATTYFEKAVAIYPEFMNAYFDLGRSNGVLGAMSQQAKQQEEAVKYFEKAIDAFQHTLMIDTTFHDAEIQLAMVLDQKGDLDQAERYYRRYIQFAPGNIMAYNNLSYLYYRQGRMDASLGVNLTANKNMPQALDPVVNISKTYLQMGQKDSALVWMEKAYIIAPSDQGLIRKMAELYTEKGNTERAAFFEKQFTSK